jgi:DinB superfamily
MISRRLTQFCGALLLFVSAAFAQTLSPADREKGLQYLEQTRDGVVAATKGLSEAQLTFKPAPDRWSIAQVLEHITVVEGAIYGNVTENIMKAPPGAPDRDTAKIDAEVFAMVPDRTHKVKAPEQFVPNGRWPATDTLDQFLKTRARTIAFFESTPDLRAHVGGQGFLGPLDAYEWIMFTAAHSARHTKQILEVKADPNFPKN